MNIKIFRKIILVLMVVTIVTFTIVMNMLAKGNFYLDASDMPFVTKHVVSPDKPLDIRAKEETTVLVIELTGNNEDYKIIREREVEGRSWMTMVMEIKPNNVAFNDERAILIPERSNDN